MSKKKIGTKLNSTFISGGNEISKYNKIASVTFCPGRPGEEYFEVVDDNGIKYQLSRDEKRHLDSLIKNK